jgi:hypothetical protein
VDNVQPLRDFDRSVAVSVWDRLTEKALMIGMGEVVGTEADDSPRVIF